MGATSWSPSASTSTSTWPSPGVGGALGLPAERLSGIYTKMIPGLGGLPKMSKSIPGSGIDASMYVEDIRALLEADTDGAPTDDGSALLQMYACLPEVDGRAYDSASTARRSGGTEWHAVREQLVERMLHLFSHWPK
ncbi:hypothetical protein NKH18_23700 [Streptomyces sp. M10(2022)]